ncbi:unnamed protein product [Bemisia tabaci]|uniref:Uncharacterized protein n=1 Tax=Bemisia tabaci TaxID=7038 RepID=A0A9P0A7M2_BEMTA|nr:unnamed protein product [Bemisia tabaci]
MDEQNRMMHPVSGQVGMMPQPYMPVPDPSHGNNPSAEEGGRKQDISEILTQIMNITDQSLDEAQARMSMLKGVRIASISSEPSLFQAVC